MNKQVLFCAVSGAFALLTGLGAYAQSTYSNAVAALNPVAYWPLNETVAPSGGLYVATNSGTLGAVGNGYYETWWATNGVANTLYSSNSIVHITGAITNDTDTALQQGGIGQYVVIPRYTNGVANAAVTITAPFSIEMWVYPTNSTASQLKPILAEGFNNVQLTNSGYATVAQGVAIGEYGTFIYFNTYNGAGAKSEIDTISLLTNKWYHLVATFDGTTKRLYTNGVLVTTQVPVTANGTNYAADLISPLVVGGGNELGISGGANVPFGGGIDEVAIYSTNLSVTQITNHYAYGTNWNRVTPYAQIITNDTPKIYLRLDEPAFAGAAAPGTYPTANNYGSLATAANGNYLPGSTPGVAGPAYSGFGSPSYAVALNGFNSGVDIGGGSLPALLNPTANQPLTVAAWFKGNPADCVGRFQTLAGHGNSSWRLNLDLNAGVQFNPGNGPLLSFANVNDELANGLFVNDGNWHLVAGVSTGTNDYLYVDGLLAKSGAAAGSIGGSSMDVILGGDPQFTSPQPVTGGSGGGQWFDGSLAQVAFFTNALSGSQIQGLFSAAGVAPAVRVQPLAQQSLDAGATGSLAATVSGSTPMAYQWYQNASPVSGQTNATLAFTPVTTGTAGSYYLIATNNFGAVTTAVAQVTVFQPNTYSYAVRQLNPAAYWPLNETTQPPNGQYIATNSGTAGTAGNGYYESWYQPVTYTNANGVITNTFYATNHIQHIAGPTGNSGDTALVCGNVTGAGQFVVIPRTTNGIANGTITLNYPFSIEAWVKTTNITANTVRPIVVEGRNQSQGNASHSYTNSEYGFYLGQYTNFFSFQLYNGNTPANSGALIPSVSAVGIVSNAWYHVVATYDGSTESLYTNGVLAGSASMNTYAPDVTSPLIIGSGTDVAAANGGNEFSGAIDDVAIYNTCLSQTQVQTHYAATVTNYAGAVLSDSPSIYLRMDEPAFSSYPSPSTYPVATNYGTVGITGNGAYMPGTTPGVAGPPYAGFGSSGAVAINGFYGAVDIGGGVTPALLNPTGVVPQTVTAWFQANPVDARFQEIVSRGDSSWRLAVNGYNGSPSTAPFDLHFNPGNNPSDVGFASIADVITNNCFINDGNWHFATGVSDGTNAYLYIDGVLAKQTNAVGSLAGAAVDALIGCSPGHTTPSYNTAGTLRYFDGQIAQVAYFTNALSAAQIQQIYGAAGVPLTLVSQPQPVTNNSGSSATMTVGIAGSAPVYQWYSTNVNTSAVAPVAGQTNANLNFNPVSLGNAGYYFVIATNSYSSVTSSVAQLTVVGPPVVLAQSATNIQVFQGTAPKLNFTVFGPAPLIYQWSSNSVPLTGATAASYAPSTAALGTNVYSCIVTNTYGAATNQAITFAVIADPGIPYPDQVISNGPVAYFRLDETGGTTAYDYAGGNNGVYTNVSLGLSGYSANDPGEYAAEFGDVPPNNDYAGNVPSYLNFGTPNGSNAEFTVEAWATEYFYENGGNCIVGLGYGNGGEQFVLDTGNGSAGDLRFLVRNAAGTAYHANATNYLANDGLWHHIVGVCDEANGSLYVYLDGKLAGSGTIPAGSGLLASTTPLSIGARQSGNFGGTNYDFQFIGKVDDVAIYNRAFNATQVQTDYLASGVGPQITQIQPATWTTNQAANVTFTVTAYGTAPLAYQWTDNNGNPIPWGTSATLNLTNVQISNAGTYTVSVTNLYGGPVTATVNLSVTQVPEVLNDITPSNLVVYATTTNTLAVTVSGTPPLSYQWYQNSTLVPGATNTTYTFGALLGTNTYYLSVTNIYSLGTPTVSSTATVVGMPVTTLAPTNYTDNLKITFPGYTRAETLADFPVLVRLSTNLTGFNYNHFADPAGGDLRFTDAGGIRVIPSEIDQWNTNGESDVWVQVPALAGTNTTIWAYWGNSSATIPPPGTNVWIPQPWEGLPAYDVVYHLKESGFPYDDSTLQFTSTAGTAPSPVAGIVGTGESFSSSPYLDAGAISVGNAFTLSAWVNTASNATSCRAIWASKGGSDSNGFALYVNFYQTADQELVLETCNGAGSVPTLVSPVGAVSSNQWHFVTATVNRAASSAQLYVDGVPLAGTGSVRPDFATNEDVWLGQFPGKAFAFDGLLDEARIDSGLNSSNWVWASWMTVAQTTNLETYSSIVSTVTNPPTPVTILVGSSGSNVYLTGTGGTAGATYYVLGTTNLLLPLSSWTVLSTNAFDGSGNFSNSMPVDLTKQALFLRIRE